MLYGCCTLYHNERVSSVNSFGVVVLYITKNSFLVVVLYITLTEYREYRVCTIFGLLYNISN